MNSPSAARRNWRPILRAITAILFVLAGVNHFRSPLYRRLIPPSFPAPELLVVISGIAEIAGGVGLLIRPLRVAAAWGLVALLIAVFPANLYMAMHPDRFADLHFPLWLLWLRLPLQGVFIVWVLYVSRDASLPASPTISLPAS